MKTADGVNTIEYVTNLVRQECQKDTNFYGYEMWSSHIVYVVKYAKILAKKLNADYEIVILAALMHDLAKIKNKELEEEHHIYGANEAKMVLTKINYPADKIEKVMKCIIAHRSSKNIPRLTIEEICVASADGIAHIDQSLSLLCYMHKKRNLDYFESIRWVQKKIEKSWAKLCPEAKDIIREKYLCLQLILNI